MYCKKRKKKHVDLHELMYNFLQYIILPNSFHHCHYLFFFIMPVLSSQTDQRWQISAAEFSLKSDANLFSNQQKKKKKAKEFIHCRHSQENILLRASLKSEGSWLPKAVIHRTLKHFPEGPFKELLRFRDLIVQNCTREDQHLRSSRTFDFCTETTTNSNLNLCNLSSKLRTLLEIMLDSNINSDNTVLTILNINSSKY